MTTSSVVKGCLPWCAGNSHAWSSKCTWKNCKRCAECTSIPTTAAPTVTTTQAMTTSSAVKGCLPWCAGNSHTWTSKCVWKNCRKCDECATIQNTNGCKNWCAGNSKEWSAKCEWKSCRRCDACGKDRRLQHRSDPSVADVPGPVVLV